MSADVPRDPWSPPDPAENRPPAVPPPYWILPPARPKFQHRYRRHLILFGLTFFTTTFAQVFQAVWILLLNGVNPLPLFNLESFVSGLWYSVPLLAILSAHEFGHYFACRYYNVDATLPYYLPLPIGIAGTLGAVIRIREPFPSKRALFDIGVAGPIAGFLMLLPFLILGMSQSEVASIPTDRETLYFGEPLLWKVLERMQFGVIPEGMDVFVNPMALAAWWGMLATAINLLPFGQLDGGHITYAALGRRSTWFSATTLLAVMVLTMQSSSWFLMGLMMAAMALLFGLRHPRVIDEHEPLDGSRRVVAVMALVIFVLCFTPVPIEIVGGP